MDDEIRHEGVTFLRVYVCQLAKQNVLTKNRDDAFKSSRINQTHSGYKKW